MASIWGELRRRNVFRAGIAYLVSAWLVAEIAGVFLPVFNAAGWILQVLMIALALGLPIALVFSWFFEISADGIKRTDEIAQHSSAGQLFDRRVDFVVIGLLVGGLLFSLYGNFRGTDAPPESVSILIADFDNQTENELFSGIIEEALLVELVQDVQVGGQVAPLRLVLALDDRDALRVCHAGLSPLRVKRCTSRRSPG